MSLKRAAEIVLSPAQAEIICHRLEVPDAIADALTEDEVTHAAVIELAELMLREVERDAKLYLSSDSAQLRRDIAAECMDGSTYYAGLWDEDQLKLCRTVQSLEALARKFAAAGMKVTVVTW